MANSLIYKPLPRKCRDIRILHLQESTDTNSILDCRLEVTSLNIQPQYEAISYCWGHVTGTEVILLNGVRYNAPASSAKVLRRYRPSYSHRTFWIDALGINQADTEERSSQVSIMDQIIT